jgi:hypothetical protein
MKALINTKAVLTVEAGSIVEISESQFLALGDKATAYKEVAKEAEAVEEPTQTASKKTTKKKKGE